MSLRNFRGVTISMLLGLCVADAGAQTISSTRMKGVIDSSGIGNIDLFRASVQSRNLTAADLEQVVNQTRTWITEHRAEAVS